MSYKLSKREQRAVDECFIEIWNTCHIPGAEPELFMKRKKEFVTSCYLLMKELAEDERLLAEKVAAKKAKSSTKKKTKQSEEEDGEQAEPAKKVRIEKTKKSGTSKGKKSTKK